MPPPSAHVERVWQELSLGTLHFLNCLLKDLHALQGLMKLPVRGFGHSPGSVRNHRKGQWAHPTGAGGHGSSPGASHHTLLFSSARGPRSHA